MAGMGVVGLLHHRAEQAGELRQVALKDRLAEIDVAEHPLARVGEARIGRGVEHGVGVRGEMGRRGDGAGFLAGEVMEERALGEAGLGADVLDAGGRIALRADHVDGGVEQPFVRARGGRRLAGLRHRVIAAPSGLMRGSACGAQPHDGAW